MTTPTEAAERPQYAPFDENKLHCECCGEPVYGAIIYGKATDLTPLYLVDDLRLCLECATEDQPQ